MPDQQAREFADRVDRAMFFAWIVAAVLLVMIAVVDPFQPMFTASESSERAVGAHAFNR